MKPNIRDSDTRSAQPTFNGDNPQPRPDCARYSYSFVNNFAARAVHARAKILKSANLYTALGGFSQLVAERLRMTV